MLSFFASDRLQPDGLCMAREVDKIYMASAPRNQNTGFTVRYRCSRARPTNHGLIRASKNARPYESEAPRGSQEGRVECRLEPSTFRGVLRTFAEFAQHTFLASGRSDPLGHVLLDAYNQRSAGLRKRGRCRLRGRLRAGGGGRGRKVKGEN